jgi:hypothetical protein
MLTKDLGGYCPILTPSSCNIVFRRSLLPRYDVLRHSWGGVVQFSRTELKAGPTSPRPPASTDACCIVQVTGGLPIIRLSIFVRLLTVYLEQVCRVRRLHGYLPQAGALRILSC